MASGVISKYDANGIAIGMPGTLGFDVGLTFKNQRKNSIIFYSNSNNPPGNPGSGHEWGFYLMVKDSKGKGMVIYGEAGFITCGYANEEWDVINWNIN